MPESILQPKASGEQDQSLPNVSTGELDKHSHEEQNNNQSDNRQNETTGVKGIWTPTFLLIFASTLVLGLSAASLFTQGWYASLFGGAWILLIQVALGVCAWSGLGYTTRSRWMRVGSIFGGLCSAFMLCNIVFNLQGLNPNAPLQSYFNVATCMTLLGAYCGISIKSAMMSLWDTWLVFLVPILAAVGVTLTYNLTLQANILTLENTVAMAALIASCIFWWFRPSCWKRQPGPTFLFGLAPAILVAIAPINMSLHNLFLLQVTWPSISIPGNANNFFFAQVVQLCLLLGCLRLIQSEKVK